MTWPTGPWEWTLTVLGATAFAVAAWSVVAAVTQGRAVRRGARAPLPNHTPRACVVVACRGVEAGLKDNLRRVLRQDYPAYRVLFALNDPADPAHDVVRAAAAESGVAPASVVFSGPFEGCSGKVAALRAAVAATTAEDEVLAFLDSDARPGPGWLRRLVAPLADPTLGATTGYRWYVSPEGGFWSAVQAAWSALGFEGMMGRYAFVWGGSYAVRRDRFLDLGIPDAWRDAFSDDLVVTRRLQEAGLPIRFLPSCVLPTHEDATRRRVLDWTARQFAIVWVYAPDMTRFAALAFAAVHVSSLVGLVLLGLAAWRPGLLLPGLLFASHLPATVARTAYRHRTFSRVLDPAAPVPWGRRAAFALAGLVVPFVTLYDYLRVRRSRRVTWRGTTYELLDRNRVRVVR